MRQLLLHAHVYRVDESFSEAFSPAPELRAQVLPDLEQDADNDGAQSHHVKARGRLQEEGK